MKTSITLGAGALLLAACAGMEANGPSAIATVRPASGSQVHGEVRFTQAGARVRVTGEIAGLTPGPHGFHVHEKGDCGAPDGMSTGGHFNPHGRKHGAPDSPDRHTGDLGNIVANEYGKATVMVVVDGISVGKGGDGVIGRAVIVHAGSDDLRTDPTGNAGGRIGCGEIS